MAVLERRQLAGLAFWISPALESLGVVHAFSTRHGGVSASPFDSLNLGRALVDEPDAEAHVQENLRRFRVAALAGLDVVSARQVHGAAVVDASALVSARVAAEASIPREASVAGASRACRAWVASGCDAAQASACEADAIVADTAGIAAMIRVADCAPVLLACARSGIVAAVHAGWRGVVSGVIEATIDRMAARGADVRALRAAIGPCIGARAFEVGEEVAAQFEQRELGESVRPRPGMRPTIDLACAVRRLLLRAGLAAPSIDGGELCTVELAEDFFSYRRDGARSGRMAAAIART